MDRLLQILKRIDGKGYGAYKELAGTYQFADFTLFIDHVQGDPFASPTRIRVRVAGEKAGFPPQLWASKPRRIGLQDYLARQVAVKAKVYCGGVRGTGKSGLLLIDAGGQEILERTALVISAGYVEARLSVGLPADGRRIKGALAAKMLTEELAGIVRASLFYKRLDAAEVLSFVQLKEDQQFIREELVRRKLVAFVADGAVLPRESGASDRPMKGQAVPFEAPPGLAVEMDLPNRGTVRGMGIPEGVTLIVGGGYHGKSTLLKAIERGVYDHIPGDGRELVITRCDAVKIRAEDGRRVEKVDISPFINNLPFGKDTVSFSTEDASGSTSQAANIMEALEIGTSLLLLDEDTSATNFMIRDARMQALVAREKEPITPFVDKVKLLYKDKGVSTILVMGGSGDYFDVADLVIMMDGYRPHVVTGRARELAGQKPTGRRPEGGAAFGEVRHRVPLKQGFKPERGGRVKVDAKGLSTIIFGTAAIDLSFLEQLVDPGQTRAIADILLYLSRKYFDGQNSLSQAIRKLYGEIEEKGLDVVSPFYGKHPGDYAMPRPQEVAGAVNRLRTLMVR
ncbi:MAG: ABC-ATPase domain-containing protein [Pelotomaculum sp.]|uniref:Predicted ATPase n=1 Tax=Pelotomaculum thermopropionicum (strain DSM 13744 / JCM 10971 / SI) TaxID=370438 RepID=A5D4V0_PELTS|nr:ABC-ATPase domain-containing protein [Pelotomaculum sp.]BAF58737.1 predicted ATPase [Pelotomaculum thermopropionicum SI]